MGVTAVYFSPTGNTKRSVEAMAAALDPGYKTVDLTLPSDTGVSCQFGPEDLVIIGMPVYAGRIPMVAVPRLSGLKGNGTPCILVATYGNRHYDDALVEMEDIAREHGFAVRGGAPYIWGDPDGASGWGGSEGGCRVCKACGCVRSHEEHDPWKPSL